MAALPKRKISTRRQGKRRAANKLAKPTLGPCPRCQQLKPPHQVCPNCDENR
ncbi:50S ribosomal protein L32 [Candidatus Shapirobacteria bacterium CG10_big_fil_rev_8_21_14_0_10_48_15]|uniref:Large ribosomal subunit protein bL32 n=1 Tax=Candidatus Shapirobacteria bacterium CG10_big_fil_rev_8_21_14_0_10_48_15 TaxID=1974484 RepID=A0A2M8L793_9BACT|nr:MAG: 50S ribosomal protein L32 [Candidatus Shapirobacteria bacterium CG10_big_fil_rev_8_21_14_0_10_48_15]